MNPSPSPSKEGVKQWLSVILSEAKNLRDSSSPSFAGAPQNDIIKRPLEGGGRQGVRFVMDTEEACQVCGYVSNLGAVAPHHLIPKSVTQQAGAPESRTVGLCCNCHFELHAWYKLKVADVAYDTKTKRFRPKSWDEKVKDYESAFKDFKKYMHEQRKSR